MDDDIVDPATGTSERGRTGDARGRSPSVPKRQNAAGTIRERPRFHVLYLLLAIAGVIVLRTLWTPVSGDEPLAYSQFQQLLESDQVAEVVVDGDTIRGTLKAPLEDGRRQFVTERVEPGLADDLAAHDVVFSSRPADTVLPIVLSWVLPAALFLGVWVVLMRRMAGQMSAGSGLLSIGKSKAKVYVETNTQVTFNDVAGVDEAKAELEEVVAFLKDPKGYGRLGARMPKGILLVGPPGTGKTLLARAVAGEAGVRFFSISGSEFVEMFVGVGAARVRDLFQKASEQAPCIIFVDELDALGKARHAQAGFGGHDEKEQTLNQLLVELDGFDPRAGIVLLAATNRPEILDPALLRAGRFDRHVLVDRPDRIGRAAIVRVHLTRVQFGGDVDADQVAALTPGFTGADLANLVNEAALVATRRQASAVEMADFTAAIERIVAGLEKRNRLLNPRERQIVAHHEMGHALVAAALPGVDTVHKVSIIPRGIGALGYTLQRPTEDRYLMTRDEMDSKLAVLQGGRAAELLSFGHYSTGAADDLARVADIAHSMVTRYAMVPELGSVSYDDQRDGAVGMPGLSTRRHSEATAREIDLAVRSIVTASFDRAQSILAANRDLLDTSAATLLEQETLDATALRPFFENVQQPDAASVDGTADLAHR